MRQNIPCLLPSGFHYLKRFIEPLDAEPSDLSLKTEKSAYLACLLQALCSAAGFRSGVEACPYNRYQQTERVITWVKSSDWVNSSGLAVTLA